MWPSFKGSSKEGLLSDDQGCRPSNQHPSQLRHCWFIKDEQVQDMEAKSQKTAGEATVDGQKRNMAEPNHGPQGPSSATDPGSDRSRFHSLR